MRSVRGAEFDKKKKGGKRKKKKKSVYCVGYILLGIYMGTRRVK